MSALWTFEELVEATGGRPLGAVRGAISGISIDTRSLQPGDAFFAIQGERFDGHDFATAAMAAGASLLVVSEAKLPALGRLAVAKLVVPDVLKALEDLGRAARARTKAKVIGVTGSVGKTSTKEMMRQALSSVGTVHAADRSFNNHWGVPLTLARMPADCDYAVVEIGMNHPGEIRPLVKMVRPHIAVVTLIAAAHLGFFKSLDEIARAKAEIFEGVVKGGSALINRDDKRWKLLSTLAAEAGVKTVWGFGESARADVRLLHAELGPQSSTLTVKIAGKEIEARLGAPGRHMVQNALAVLGAAHLAGADVAHVALALGSFRAEAGRGQRHRLRLEGGSFTLIDESYNANPASMAAAFDLLGKAELGEGGRRIAILGDMAELGSHSEKLHAGLADLVAKAGTQRLFLAGKEMKALADALPADLPVEHRERADDLRGIVVEAVRPGDAVMIKSSKSIGFNRLVDAFLNTFPSAATGD
ncbi:UDP-N-acetylmuramoylalanyl-D-glutamyl-2,6-diaminopimelate--D-alanyl-D-alanine ligase [Nitratireductor sp. ZSWI3]|uniref:UDP-N-acetylmuramoylalanyl-D-glutamyl-2, 6-diaminopimelate--D-alanyl-D-alanine ligase n=1 Tax=Nitratireductor sp. ZSWI3 TaxID=2966359 RepID=UPI002150083C|nr:UDP-N-acetylmuramoylalanyl-D-glutamyl-2,6-diaminopimelate--D-alanyl-D-alanine ligase [Nitratireductor sp. ZSWI3]MCR4266053.1 UDP-N-acetylmuramoylalanyl-D-glutamyl-2,6-diaminopimelate--D-alanyl-D-alanine ligase [Nitratireductor sp. ZSWI3]